MDTRENKVEDKKVEDKKVEDKKVEDKKVEDKKVVKDILEIYLSKLEEVAKRVENTVKEKNVTNLLESINYE